MKLFKVFPLYGTCMLVSLPLLFGSVKTLATEATTATNNLNDIDLYNNNSLSSTTTGSVSHFRGKRFIAFPVGSSFSTAVCMTTGVIGNPNYQYLSMGLNWGIAYELPNSTWVLQQANGFGTNDSGDVLEAKIKRRHRRDLYGKLETLINGMPPAHYGDDTQPAQLGFCLSTNNESSTSRQENTLAISNSGVKFWKCPKLLLSPIDF